MEVKENIIVNSIITLDQHGSKYYQLKKSNDNK